MDKIANLTEINYVALLLWIFAITFAVKEIIEIVGYFKKKFRIKTGIETDKDILEERIATLEKHDKWQYEEITKISKGIEDINKRLIDKEIDDWRYEILDMASAISMGRRYNKEQFDHILVIHRKYETLLDSLGMKNGQVDASMEVIEEVYKEKLKNGF